MARGYWCVDDDDVVVVCNGERNQYIIQLACVVIGCVCTHPNLNGDTRSVDKAVRFEHQTPCELSLVARVVGF